MEFEKRIGFIHRICESETRSKREGSHADGSIKAVSALRIPDAGAISVGFEDQTLGVDTKSVEAEEKSIGLGTKSVEADTKPSNPEQKVSAPTLKAFQLRGVDNRFQ